MDVVVNDTNIFIDLLSVELLEEAFKLPIDFHTVDYVVSEIVDSYQNVYPIYRLIACNIVCCKLSKNVQV